MLAVTSFQARGRLKNVVGDPIIATLVKLEECRTSAPHRRNLTA
jgi:hypothetical protein